MKTPVCWLLLCLALAACAPSAGTAHNDRPGGFYGGVEGGLGRR